MIFLLGFFVRFWARRQGREIRRSFHSVIREQVPKGEAHALACKPVKFVLFPGQRARAGKPMSAAF
ncbi:MAG: hypothetical protein DLM61_01235 [Pseudonocardiales bacterium]|nr:hypothetical protein [Pseudonocardiales bacterium]PZS35898.1 MAG: hypothetical protein DLM61_01235 [Pseudonocardiales bacterium]